MRIDTRHLDKVELTAADHSETDIPLRPEDYAVRADQLVEIRLSRQKVAQSPDEKVSFKIIAMRNQMPIDVIPAVGEAVIDPKSYEMQSKLWP